MDDRGECSNDGKPAVVIGGGPAGLMAAIQAARQGREVKVLEKGREPARKLLLTGDGRCNLTSTLQPAEVIAEIFTGASFLYSAIYQFTPEKTRNFFEELGLSLKEERGRRLYPASGRAEDVKRALLDEAKRQGVAILTGREVEEIITADQKIRGVKVKGESVIRTRKVLLATGGKSYPGTGSDGSGYRLAARLGHRLVEPELALVPLKVEENWTGEAAGLKLKNVELDLFYHQDKIFSCFGELIIEDRKITGAEALRLSCHVFGPDYHNYRIFINLKPALNQEQLRRRLQQDFNRHSNKYFKNSLDDLLPAYLRPVIVRLSGISPDKVCHQITAGEREKLVQLLKGLQLSLRGKGSENEAIITAGGVAAADVNPGTMESKKISGLHFAGEILEPAAYTGGHNLQIAFSTGYLAGSHL